MRACIGNTLVRQMQAHPRRGLPPHSKLKPRAWGLWRRADWWNGERERLTRRREVFSKAYAAVQKYKEFPYVIARRRKDEPEEERIRISSE